MTTNSPSVDCRALRHRKLLEGSSRTERQPQLKGMLADMDPMPGSSKQREESKVSEEEHSSSHLNDLNLENRMTAARSDSVMASSQNCVYSSSLCHAPKQPRNRTVWHRVLLSGPVGHATQHALSRL